MFSLSLSFVVGHSSMTLLYDQGTNVGYVTELWAYLSGGRLFNHLPHRAIDRDR